MSAPPATPATPASAEPAEVLAALAARGLDEAEVLVKRGRSRRLETTPASETAGFSHERGWAVRAAGRGGSFFVAGTGEPPAGGPWPAPSGPPLALPEPATAPPWNPPSELDAPLIGERDGLRLLESLGKELAAELPGARLLRAVLEDGSSESEIASSRGVRARSRSRVAALWLEAAGPGRSGPTATLYLAARDARRFTPQALARRLADRLSVAAQGGAPERDRGEFLLAPAVAARILAELSPLLVGPRAIARLAPFRDRRGRIGADALTIVDDGRLPGGVFESATDGEGMPCREVVLVEGGTFHQPLLAWWQARAAEGRPSGCSRRAGFRDLPAPGPTHLYVRPEPKASVANLLGGMARGYYLIDTTGSPRFDLDGDAFSVPVCGFAVQGGRASAPVARAWLCGTVSALLRGIAAVGRDLTFFPLDGMIGAPTLLVTGLELRGTP